MYFIAIKTAFFAAIIAIAITALNWIVNLHFISVFFAGWHVSNFLN